LVVRAQLTMTVIIVLRKPHQRCYVSKKKERKKVATNREAVAALCSKATDWLKQ